MLTFLHEMCSMYCNIPVKINNYINDLVFYVNLVRTCIHLCILKFNIFIEIKQLFL